MHVHYPSWPSSGLVSPIPNFSYLVSWSYVIWNFLSYNKFEIFGRKWNYARLWTIAKDWFMAWLWIAQRGKCATSLKVTELNWIFDVTFFNLLDLHYLLGRLHCVLIEFHFLSNFEVTHIDKKQSMLIFLDVCLNLEVLEWTFVYPNIWTTIHVLKC
jgi:hypothetical protein